jgi:hypothetical protein
MSLSWYTSVVAIHAARACASGARTACVQLEACMLHGAKFDYRTRRA